MGRRKRVSGTLGGILAVADYLARKSLVEGYTPPKMREVLTAMIKAHEIQGVLALENSFNRLGLDHVILVRVASTAVVTAMLGAMRSPTRGSTAGPCEPIAMHRTPAPARVGRRVMQPVAPYGTLSSL